MFKRKALKRMDKYQLTRWGQASLDDKERSCRNEHDKRNAKTSVMVTIPKSQPFITMERAGSLSWNKAATIYSVQASRRKRPTTNYCNDR